MAESHNHSLNDSMVSFLKTHRQIMATAPAASLAVLAGAPLENVKTRMQSKYFTSALACTKYTYRTEGLRGFWVGTWSPLVSLVITRSAQFQIYRWAKYKIDRVIEQTTGQSPLQHVNTVGTYPNLSTCICFGGAGMLAGGLLTPVLTPVELVKNCAQTSVLMAAEHTKAAAGSAKNAGRISSYQAVQQIVRERGLSGLFIGFRLHLVRDVVGSGIYFGVYEALKQSLNSAYGVSNVNAPGSVLFAGAACGALAWCVTYPLDSMKTRAQNSLVGASAKQAASVMANEVGKAKFSKYKGIEMVLLRSAFQGMIQQSIFEEAKRFIDELEFSDGSTTLPYVDRQLGRDKIVKKDNRREE